MTANQIVEYIQKVLEVADRPADKLPSHMRSGLIAAIVSACGQPTNN